jgi:hypothetical protein
MEGLDLDLEQLGTAAAKPAQKYHKGKIEYAPPFYTINVQHVEHMPEYEVIGVNGEVIQVTRGVDVQNIPQAFVNVLRQAVTSKLFTSKKPDGSGDELHEWKPVAAIPFSIVEGPYQERKND